MKHVTAASAAALSFGIALSPATAQDEAAAMLNEGFAAWTANDVFATQLLGIAVMATDGQIKPSWIEEVEFDQRSTVDSSELEGVRYVGRITDMMLTQGGEPVAFVISQLAESPDAITGLPADAAVDASQMPVAAVPEVAIVPERLMLLSDSVVPHLIFAVIDMSADEFYAGPRLDRAGIVATPEDTTAAIPGLQTGWRTGWHAGRNMMMPPDVAVPGFAQTPAIDVSVNELTGAPIYGINNEYIGDVDSILRDPDGELSYLTTDVGGFLGIGSREIAVGFEEVTVLRNVNRLDLQVHVAATREMLEEMPHYER